MPPKHVFDILVAGEINPDLILSGNVIPEFVADDLYQAVTEHILALS